MTRPQTWGKPLGLTVAMTDTAAFVNRLTTLEDGPAIWNRLAELSRQYAFAGRQIHGANIVATMLAHGEHRAGDFQYEGLRALLTLRSSW
jgi:hypothetical protein